MVYSYRDLKLYKAIEDLQSASLGSHTTTVAPIVYTYALNDDITNPENWRRIRKFQKHENLSF